MNAVLLFTDKAVCQIVLKPTVRDLPEFGKAAVHTECYTCMVMCVYHV